MVEFFDKYYLNLFSMMENATVLWVLVTAASCYENWRFIVFLMRTQVCIAGSTYRMPPIQSWVVCEEFFLTVVESSWGAGAIMLVVSSVYCLRWGCIGQCSAGASATSLLDQISAGILETSISFVAWNLSTFHDSLVSLVIIFKNKHLFCINKPIYIFITCFSGY